MDIFDFFSMAGEIAEFFKAAGEDIGHLFNPKKKTKQSRFANRKADEGWTPDELSKAREPWDFMPLSYWQDLLKEKAEEKELHDKQLIEDYEARHASEGNDEPKDSENAESSEADGSVNPDENSGVEADDSSESSGAFESDGSFESDSSFEAGDCDSGDSGSCDGYIG